MPMEEGIVGQTIPMHDGRAAEPLSALRYVQIDFRVVSCGFRRGPFLGRWKNDALLGLPKPWRNLGAPLASLIKGGRGLGYPVVRPGHGRRFRASIGCGAAGAAGSPAVR